jgi:hypothetical protein
VRDPYLTLPHLSHVAARERLHSLQAFEDMRVHSGLEHRLDSGQQVADEGRAARHPLHPVTAVAVVWAIEGTAWEEALQPTKERLVPHMHSHDDLRSATVESEVPFTDQQPDNDASLKVIEVVHPMDRNRRSALGRRCWVYCRVLARVSCEST